MRLPNKHQTGMKDTDMEESYPQYIVDTVKIVEGRDLKSNQKKCSQCKKLKPLSDYYKDSRKSDGLDTRCKDCVKKSQSRSRRNKTKEEKKLLNRKKHVATYGLTIESYQKLEDAQNNKCKICGAEGGDCRMSRLRIDHCHETGEVRGLICHKCNVGLGQFRDDLDLLKEAVKYLEEFHESKSTD